LILPAQQLFSIAPSLWSSLTSLVHKTTRSVLFGVRFAFFITDNAYEQTTTAAAELNVGSLLLFIIN